MCENMKKNIFPIFIVSALTAFFLPTPEVNSQQSLDTKAKIDVISKEIAEIRGMQFKRPVDFKYQSMEDFRKYLDKIIAKQMPAKRLKYYGKIVKKLGLHRGPEIQDFKSMAKMVFGSQVAAYYDPDLETFYVVMQKLPEKMMGALYAHELYHGLQDQYFDLDTFLLSQTSGSLNDDELLARQSVVEGEANYIMTLWTLQKTLGNIPDPAMLKMMVHMQAQMDTRMLIDMLKIGVCPAIPRERIGEGYSRYGKYSRVHAGNDDWRLLKRNEVHF